jgi:SSS family solute:Na+ symporter
MWLSNRRASAALLRVELKPCRLRSEPLQSISAADGLILLLYFFFAGGVGFSLKSFIKTGDDFLLAGRAMPAWVGGLALAGISLGGQELVLLGALGAHYGLEGAQLFGIGAIPAMLFSGLYMMPVYYASGARSVPEYLRLRFDAKTRAVYACVFAVMVLFSAGMALYVTARAAVALHVFDALFYSRHWPTGAILPAAVVVPALLVLAIVWSGGLTGALYSQVMQFFVILAGILPAVIIGLRSAGGWSGLSKALPGYMHEWRAMSLAGNGPLGLGGVGLCLGLGVALAGSVWCVDFRFLQTAFAAKSADGARRVPLIAAVFMVFLPFVVVLPGLLAVSLPTPHSTITITIENGSIVRNTTVVSPAEEAGKGIVPAEANPANGLPVRDAAGHAVLDYRAATPNLLLHFLPEGLLGLGLAALLAGLMSGVAAAISACNSVLVRDIYQPWLNRKADDAHDLQLARWVTLGAVAAALGIAFAAMYLGNIAGALALGFAFLNAPILATFLLGMFWRRATGHGAFAGMVLGMGAAIAHYGLTLPAGAQPGMHGGWITVYYVYPSMVAQAAWTALFGFAVNLLVTIAVSLGTRPRSDDALAGLVYSLLPARGVARISWWKRPEALAVAILLAAIAVNIFFA